MRYDGFRTDSRAFFQQKTRFSPRPAGPKWKFLEEPDGFSASDGGMAGGINGNVQRRAAIIICRAAIYDSPTYAGFVRRDDHRLQGGERKMYLWIF